MRPPKLLLLGLISLGLLIAAPSAMASLRYYGGPVSHSMNVYVVPWGSGVRSTYTDPATGDPGFFKYLASQSGTTTDIGGVLAQYMDTSGVNSQNKLSYGGENEITPPASGGVSGCSLPNCVDDSVIQSQLQSHINASTLPAPSGNGLQTIYVVLFPPGVNVCLSGSCAWDSPGFCAYHGSFALTSSTQALYAAIVDNGPGTPNAGACGSSTSDIANQTDIVSHEVSETINDPLVAESTSRNAPPLAWYDTNQRDPNGGGEVADICVGPNEQALNGSWTVQKIWSIRDSNCVSSEAAYSAPTASFVADTTATTAQSVSFDASASSDPSGNTASATYSGSKYSIASGLANYRWDWGDGSASTSSSSPTAAHAYASAGNYEVSLTVTDNLGFTSTVTQQIAVTGPPAPPTVTTGAASGIDSQGATLSGTINPENQTVQYEFVYGTSPTALTQSTPLSPGPTGQSASPVSATLSGLSPSTTYYYELEAVSGSQTYTDNPPSPQSFTTTAAPPTQTPSASTGTASQISTTAAELNGTINPDGPASVTYWFAYGTSPTSLNQTTPQTTEPGGSTAVPVSASISGLSPGTVYYYTLKVSFNTTTTSGTTEQFTTLTPAPTPPVVVTQAASGISSQGAMLSGTINPENQTVQYEFVYGTSPTALTQATPLTPGPTGQGPSPVSATLSGLSPSTTYYYELEAVSGSQTYTDSPPSPRSFTTAAAPSTPNPTPVPTASPPSPPGVTTGSASHVSSSGATVAGTVNPNGTATTYDVQFGPSAAYGYSSAPISAGSGTASLPVSVSLTGLKPGTTYHYRLVAMTAYTTVVGTDQTFTTAKALAAAPHLSFRVLGHPALPRVLRSGLKVRFSCSKACVTRFTVVALPANGVLSATSFPLTLASGTARLHAKGSGTATLSFTRKARSRLARTKKLRASISGVASAAGTATSAPLLRTAVLRRTG